MSNNSSANKTLEMTRLALLVAMNCVSAYIIIPLPFSLSPIALQTLIVNLVGFLLPPKQAFITMLIYIFVGLIGIPVFTGGHGRSCQTFLARQAAIFLVSWWLLRSLHGLEAEPTVSNVLRLSVSASVFP